MLKPLLKKAIPLLTMMPLLGSCSLFQPQTKVIEYDEEVKLHNGEMIWVHITRHYKLVGGAIGDPGWRESTYIPSAVEISWDTGFEGVGRRSVFFDSYVGIIDKYDDTWYVIGNKNQNSIEKINNSVSCNTVGISEGWLRCIVAINEEGEFITANQSDLEVINLKNIIYPVGIKNWGMLPQSLDDKKLSWNDKLDLQAYQPKQKQTLGQPLLELGEKK